MAVQLIFTPNYAFAEGVFAPGAKVSFFLSGTTTPQTVYSDDALTVAHPAPLVADASGQFATVWADSGVNVKAVVTDADDSTIATYDPVVLGNISGGDGDTTSFTPIPGNGATTVQQAITNNTTLITTGFDEFLEIPALAGNGGKVVAVKADASDIELATIIKSGTWTPVPGPYSFVTAPDATTNSVEGRYTRVGDMVTVWFYVDGFDKGNMDNNAKMSVSGLPYSAASASTNITPVGDYMHNQVGGVTDAKLYIEPGDNAVVFSASSLFSDIINVDLVGSDISSSNVDLRGSITYRTDDPFK